MHKMKIARLENLADGVFAIVMTLIVLELRVPEVVSWGQAEIQQTIIQLFPYFMSYLTSFALLYTYWHSHHFLMSLYTKEVTFELSNKNAFFLFLIGLVPFSTHFLARYHLDPLVISIFSIHIIAIGLSLYDMRNFIKYRSVVEHEDLSYTEEFKFQSRLLFPVICAGIAFVVSFFSPVISLFALTLGVLFNFIAHSTKVIVRLFTFFHKLFHV